MKKDIVKTRILIYLLIVLIILYIPWLVGLLIPKYGEAIYAIIRSPLVFMTTPAIAVFLTRIITKDREKLHFHVNFFKNKKALIFSALFPAISIFLGSMLFFVIFPDDLDFKGQFISQTYAQFGAPEDIEFTVSGMLIMGVIVLVISAIAVPVWFIALGEDIGWQGYLLPLLCKKMTSRKAVIVTGILWGLAHAPLIFCGLNYGTEYIGAPYTGILMMVVVTVVLEIWMAFITFRTKNCMYAAIIHGAVDVIGEAGNFISLSSKSSLLGPTPPGIIGLSFLLVGSVILFIFMPKKAFED